MATDSLFPPTPLERLAAVVKVLDEERSHRVHMLVKYAGDASQLRTWKKRVAQCDEAACAPGRSAWRSATRRPAHLAALSEAVAP